MRTRLLCVPSIRDVAEGVRLLERLAFHLHFVEVDRIELIVDDAAYQELSRAHEVLEPGAAMHGTVGEHHARIRDRIELMQASEVAANAWPHETDYVIVWDQSRSEDWGEGLVDFARRGRLVLADEGLTGSANEALARFASRLHGEENSSRKRSLELFESFLRRVRPVDLVSIVLDPHLAPVLPPGGVVLAGNATLPHSLLSQPGPKVMTIFDFEPLLGMSAQAEEARAGLEALADIPDGLIVLPNVFHAMFTSLCPGLAHLTVGMAAASPSLVEGTLPLGFTFREGAPVSTEIMFPLASMLTDQIRVVSAGADATNEQWENAIQTAEDSGSQVLSVGESALPALCRRAAGGFTPPRHTSTDATEFILVSLNPDWVDEMGHHAHFDRSLREATLAKGGIYQSLVSKAMLPEDPSWQIPTFTHATYGFDTTHAGPYVTTFREELETALGELVASGDVTPKRVIMYSAGLAHLPSIIDVASTLSDPTITFHVNLLRSHADLLADTDGDQTIYAHFLKEAIEVGREVGVHLLADTEKLNDMVALLTGYRLDTWPMVGVTPLPESDLKTIRPCPDDSILTFCYPATQEIKGLEYFAALAELMSPEAQSRGIEFIARDVGTIRQPATQRMKDAGVRLIPGVLSPDEYRDFIQQADVIVLPYKSNPFRIQTSGAVADAVKLRTPMIATEATWAGRLIEEHGIGTTFAEGDLDGFRRAVLELRNGYEGFVDAMHAFAPGWLDRNNPSALLEAIASGVPGSHPGPDASNRAQRLAEVQGLLTEAVANESARSRAESAELHREAADLADRLGRRDQEVDELIWTVRHLEHRLDLTRSDRDTAVAKLEAEVARQETRIETRDRELVEHGRQIAELNATISRLETRITTREETIAHLKLAVADLQARFDTATERHTATQTDLQQKLAHHRRRVAELEGRFIERVWRAIKRRGR